MINCDEYLQPPYLTRLVVTEYRQYTAGGGTPYTVHRTPYSGSPGEWPAPLARILPFRRYPPKTPKTPPSPPLLLLTPGRAVRCPRSIFFKIEFAHTAVFSAIIYFPPKPTFTLPEPDLTSSLLQPAPTRLHYTGPATLCFRSRLLLSGG